MKRKINISQEVAKIWQEAKDSLRQLGKRTLKLAERGEKEVVRASKVGKLQLDIVTISLKKENVFRQVGKKAHQMHAQKGHLDAAKLATLFAQIDKLDQSIRAKKAAIAKLKRD